ncbi:MinD/ParA family protein, partial [Pseudonocardia sp. N23]|uniref:MinD/ParA family ATP-binding protein n=1 Tax=Pseudonocardia sp. N23 TaxID=1987376 RepID=UPI00209C24B0
PPPPAPTSPPPAPVGPAPAAAQPDPGPAGNAQAPLPVEFDTYLRAELVASPPPRRGVRGLLYSLSGGRVNPGASPRELAERDYLDRIRTPLSGWHTVTVASTKGGVGKTTTSALLGLTLAEHRADRVIAMDANPDAGNLADRLLGHPATATVRQLLDRPDLDQLVSFPDVARFVNNAGRLQLLASDQDAAKSEAFNRDEYRRVLALLVRFFNIVITDSGTGLIHSAMTGALESTRSLIVTGAPTIDAAGHIDKTLDSLVAHGFDELVADAVIVLSCDRRARRVDPAALRSHFENRCRAVVEIPRDPHLTEGGQIDLDALRPRTRAAARELAALVADAFCWDFPTPRGFTTGPGR